ncbi:MAG TPA: non-ribosomal peptide synthetase, partial [Calditrichae bacterium]|nr:non-ribosomal peptide synthetase [Calditrichia bacterium]
DRVYRSGDRVRMLPNGTLEFLGRIDDQVKLRGFRIEIPEIEAVIKEHPGVKDAVVALRTDGGTEYLAAYLIPESDEIDSAELREFLKSRLPEFMIPAAFVTMDAFPLLPNGKVNRRNLPAPEGFVVQREYVAPRTPQEEVVAGIFADILNLEKVGALDNFFELGGHSLLATQLVSRLRDAFQIEIPLKELFENPTVEGIARRVQEAQAAEAGMQAPPIEPIPRDGELPLSFAQQRLWFLDQLQPGSAFYNIPMALRIKGNLQYDAMNQTIAEIIRRHEVLRTTFENVEGKPRVVIHPPEPVTVPITDLQDLPEAERETRARELAKAEAQAPFDLAKGPLFRVQLLKLAEDDHIALVTVHHIISDGWSMAIFVREVGLLYPKYIKGNGQVLSELKIQYVDYAAWQRKWLQGEVLQRQLDFWKRHLEGAPPVLELPTDKPRPAIQTFNGTVARMAIPSEVLQHVRALSKKENATVFMTVLAAFYVLLHRYSGQDDIVVGTPIAGRSRSELENLIGFFVNTLALRARFTPNITFKELLRQVRETTLGAHAHQDLPFEQLVEELQPERNLSHSPIFQVMFVFQNLPLERLELPGITLQPFEAKPDIAKFDLSLIASEGPDGLMMEWEYNTDLFTEATIRRMMSHFETLLREALAQPDVPVARLPLLSEEERHRMLVEWNAT